ncbi:aspartate and glycine-rich protein isoform X2 [Colias croceus]|uniref:aspartate and glycine-rich protein isoform X2 n=1 Tax=Colias crocea TaxID=72248 RepID=UPI001E279F26|nr:aspartate and glycine-rich protein isoform X2 [Colias croceus]
MIRLISQVLLVAAAVLTTAESEGDNESILSSVLLPSNQIRSVRSYYERYGYGRPYDRDDRPSRCGRCDDDDDDDTDDRRSNKPTHGSRYDRNRNDDDDDKRYSDRRSSKNETDDQSDDKHRDHDEKDRDRGRDRPRNKHRNRYDDRDRYSPDYYDRFLRDRDRYDEPYPRRPLYERNPYPDRYDDYGRYGYSGYRRPYYDDRYDRGAYDDGYGGYGPGTGGGPHDSFRPWDETYRGQAGWDAGGRGYYFASGRPDSTAWTQRDYARPQSSSWQNVGYQSNPTYSGGYSNGYSSGYSGYATGSRDPYRAVGYQDGYGQSGWRNVGERRPYRDESGVTKLDSQDRYNRATYQPSSYQPSSFSQSTTPETSYLHQRDDQLVKVEDSTQAQ